MSLFSKTLAGLLLVIALVGGAYGQDYSYGKKPKPVNERTVTGTVTNTDGTPVPGAVVQMKNLKTLEVHSFIAKEKGDFYFSGVSKDVDYEFHAEWNGKSSATRRVSSFDEHTAITFTLQLK